MIDKILKNYKIVGTLIEEEKRQVFIASKGESSKLYIINKISGIDSSVTSELFNYFTSKKNKNFKDFFITEDYLYMIFTYKSLDNFQMKFCDELNTYTFNERLSIIHEFLLNINSLKDIPSNLLITITDINNLQVDHDGHIRLTYNLYSIPSKKEKSKEKLFQNIANIYKVLFHIELSRKHSELLSIIIKKCENGLYHSIAELLHESYRIFNKYETHIKMSWISKLKEKYAPQFKIAKVVLTMSIICIAVFIFARTALNPKTVNTNFSIGNEEYNIGLNAENQINIQPGTPTETTVVEEMYLNPKTDIQYSTYVIKKNDTIEKICNENYSNSAFVSVIKSFNSISDNSDLTPGSILRLPDENATKDTFHR